LAERVIRFTRFGVQGEIELYGGRDCGAPECPAYRAALEMLKNSAAELRRSVLVGIGGPGGSGKSTFARSLAGWLDDVRILPVDDYRKSRHERARGIYGSHPEGNRLDLLRSHLELARRGEPFERPVFCRNHGAALEGEWVPPARFILAEGEITAHRGLRDEFDLRILILADWSLQWQARMGRDRMEHGCGFRKALSVFVRSNLWDFPRFAGGARRDAHLVLRRGRSGYLAPVEFSSSKSARRWRWTSGKGNGFFAPPSE
jgi:uridine kinase